MDRRERNVIAVLAVAAGEYGGLSDADLRALRAEVAEADLSTASELIRAAATYRRTGRTDHPWIAAIASRVQPTGEL